MWYIYVWKTLFLTVNQVSRVEKTLSVDIASAAMKLAVPQHA